MNSVERLWLVVTGPSSSHVVAMTGERLTLGRDLRCDVVLDDPKASRLHAEIVRDQRGRFLLTDLSSRNGTIVDGRQLVGSLPLVGGETIRLGRTTIDISPGPPEEAT